MINEGGTEKKSNSNSQRNRIVLGAIIVLALLALLTLLANPGLFVPPNGNAEAQNQPPPANDNGNDNDNNSTSPDQGNSSYNATNENAIPIMLDNSSSNANESKDAAGDGSGEAVTSTITNDNDNKSTNTNQNSNGNDEDGHIVIVSGLASNHRPIASDRSVTTHVDTPVVIHLNASDSDGDSLRYIVLTDPIHGSLTEPDNNEVMYTPDPDYVGIDSFTYRANDGKINSDVGLVSIAIKKSYILQMEDNTFSYGVEIYSGKRATAEYAGPQSILIGKDIDTIVLWLSKEGNPQGQIEIGVFNDDLSVKKLFGTIDASDITEDADNPGQYQFSLIESDLPYTIEEGDRIGIKFTGGDIFNFIAVQVDEDPSGPFDGTNTYKSFYDTEWVDIENADMSMSLILSK